MCVGSKPTLIGVIKKIIKQKRGKRALDMPV